MAITKIQSNAFPTSIDLSNVDLTLGAGEVLTANIADSAVHTTKVADLAVTHAKLHTDMDLTSKTVVLPPLLSQTVLIGKSSAGIENAGSTLFASGAAYHTQASGEALHLNRLTDDGPILSFYKASNKIGSIASNSVAGDELLEIRSDGLFRLIVNDDVSAKEAIRVLTNGNVAIGDSGASSKLFVRSDSSDTTFADQVNVASGSGIIVQNESIVNGSWSALTAVSRNSSAVLQYASMMSVSHPSGYSPNIVFVTSTGESTSAERMRINSAGNVGIGTNSPSTKLHIDGSNYNTATQTGIRIVDHGNNTTIGSLQSYIEFGGRYWSGDDNAANFARIGMYHDEGDGNTGTGFGILTSPLGTTTPTLKLYVDSSGKVGIGTDNPLAKLNIVTDNTTQALKITSTNDWGDVNAPFVDIDGNANGTGDGNILRVKTGAARSDVEILEVVNGNGTQFLVRGNGRTELNPHTVSNPSFGSSAFAVINSTVDKNLMMPSYYGSGYVNLTYRHCFNITSDHFAVQFTGGGGNTVFTTYAIISGSHYRDILVQSYTLYYSYLKIKIVQNGSDGKSIWVAGNTYLDNLYFLEWRIFPIKACPIEMNPSSSQSEWYHVHYASSGIVSSGTGDMASGTGPSTW